jgi:hypothetical protein
MHSKTTPDKLDVVVFMMEALGLERFRYQKGLKTVRELTAWWVVIK